MDHSNRLTEMDPMPIWTPAPSDHGAQRSRSPLPPMEGHDGMPEEGIAPRLGPEGHIPDHPGSAVDYGRPASQPQPPMPTFAPPPQAPMTPAPYMQEYQMPDIRTLRQSCQYNLREYMSLQRKQGRYDASVSTVDLESRLRTQTGMVLSDLMNLQMEVRDLARAAQNHRWRRWLVGGVFASFIPLVRRIFRRGNDEESQAVSNDTEYAFQRSKNLLARIRDSIFGRGGYASIGFFVFAVLYIFQNEVSLRVAKTIQKRIKQLSDRLQGGDHTIDERDMKVLEGWRWRILLW